MKKRWLAVLCSALMVVSAACSSSGTKSGDAPGDKSDAFVIKDPVTLRVLIEIPGMTDDEWNKYFTDPVQKKYPQISFEILRPTQGQTLNDLVAAGNIPDLIYGGPPQRERVDMQIPLDLREQLKKHDIDISKINPNIMDSIKQLGDNGELYGLPFTQNAFALWYNKGIFDKFGVPYPTDGMTWDQAAELAKKVSRLEGGVNYLGLYVTHGGVTTFASPLSIEMVDKKTQQALVPDIWKTIFERAMKIYDIPNNKPKVVGLDTINAFIKDQNIAMAAYYSIGMFSFLPQAKGLDWDVVQLPSHPEAPNKYLQADYHQFLVSRTSKHIDAAMEVLKIALSDEVQTIATRSGKLTVLKNAQILDQFAADQEFAKGKNIKGIFKSEPSTLIPQSKYNGPVDAAIRKAFVSVFEGKTDINTALRTAKEEADKNIANIKLGEK
ncbi:ABC transporter substrate-binding protein [Paenibacillus allorhizosphaerae]|nr:ABC transporter substrate-binding protein [Paenibacillus allorhizosphaerae]